MMELYDFKSTNSQELASLVIDRSEETEHREAALQELLDREIGVEEIGTADLKALVEEEELAARFLRIVENALDHR